MDLVDIIAEKYFLGQEFLTWLWYKSEERGGAIELPGIGDLTATLFHAATVREPPVQKSYSCSVRYANRHALTAH